MIPSHLQDRFRGCLVGGAIGDALGNPVEFASASEIQFAYGPDGITRFKLEDGKAVITDDTQMTLFTACGLLNAQKNGKALLEGISNAYIEWYYTQHNDHDSLPKDCWIREIPELYVCRAPGLTCLGSLERMSEGLVPVNRSKGCGGVMRIAPVSLFYSAASHPGNVQEAATLAGEASRLTHKDPLGYIPSALVAHLIYRLVQEAEPTREKYVGYLKEGIAELKTIYPDFEEEISFFEDLVKKAVYAAREVDGPDHEIIGKYLGEGWTADENAAIAIYCTLKYFDDFEKAMIAAVNHDGDSDSTGAVAGNILGAAFGYENLPECYLPDLELKEVILKMADDLLR